MPANPYQTLGVTKDTSDADIKSAYRKLAKQNHPDLNPGDEKAKARFADISAAYDLLGDKDKRGSFDRGEIDGNGQPKQQQFYRDYAGGGPGQAGTTGAGRYRAGGSGFGGGFGAGASGADPASFSDFFSSMFSGGMGGGMGGGAGPSPGTRTENLDRTYSADVDFLDAAIGGSQRVTMPTGETLDINIPEGVADGAKLRLKGKGSPGSNGQTGDAFVELHIRAHPVFTRDGNTVVVELPIGLHESVLGARVPVPTVHGPVTMAIPRGATTGQTLRLKGKGIKGGDQMVRLKLVMPPVIDPELERLVAEWARTHSYDPRKEVKS